MEELADPAASQIVLIGTATYDHLDGLPAVRTNLESLRGLLGDPDLWGVPPENCQVLLDVADPATISGAVRAAASAVGDRGLLLIYYAGHGLVDPLDDSLVLALPGTHPHQPHERGLPYDWIRRALLAGAARRRVVILDCCYGGRAGQRMAARASPADVVADQAVIEKTCLLVAASANRTAAAPAGEAHTAFTGELVGVIAAGLHTEPPVLTIATIWRHVRDNLLGRGFERPELRELNEGGSIPLVQNAARRIRNLAGTLLWAAPSVADPELDRAAILVLRHNATGALGVRINRLEGQLPIDFPRSWLPLVNNPAELFDGGPLARDGYIVVTMLRSNVTPPVRFTPVRDRLGTLALSADPEDVGPAVYGLRVFQGYLGWDTGELEAYVEAGDLVRSDSSPWKLLSTGPRDVWQKVRDNR